MPDSSIQAMVADLNDLRSILEKLEAAGVHASQIDVISHVPIHGVLSKNKSRLGWFALVGGILGALVGFALAALTALAYPLPTGGMPILAWWPIGIVTYETTMLGAILATVLGFLVEARLPRFKPMAYDGVVDGAVLLSITKLDEPSVNRCRSILRAAGASLSESS